MINKSYIYIYMYVYVTKQHTFFSAPVMAACVSLLFQLHTP